MSLARPCSTEGLTDGEEFQLRVDYVQRNIIQLNNR